MNLLYNWKKKNKKTKQKQGITLKNMICLNNAKKFNSDGCICTMHLF